MPADGVELYFSRTVRMHFDVLLCQSAQDLFSLLYPLKLPHKLSAQKFAAGTTSCSTFVSQSPDLKAFIHMVGLPFFTFQLSPLFHEGGQIVNEVIFGHLASFIGGRHSSIADKKQCQTPVTRSLTLRTPGLNGRVAACGFPAVGTA